MAKCFKHGESFSWGGLWERIRRRLRKWRKRLSDLPSIRIDGFEVIVFWQMIALMGFFCTHWFYGPTVEFWHRVLPMWSWAVILLSIALIVLVGFFEEDYTSRRWGSFLAFFFLWCIGAWTATHFPHNPFGALMMALCTIPFWLFSRFPAMRIRAHYRQDINCEDTGKTFAGIIQEAEEGFLTGEKVSGKIVEMPRRV